MSTICDFISQFDKVIAQDGKTGSVRVPPVAKSERFTVGFSQKAVLTDARKMSTGLNHMRVGLGHDTHRLGAGRPLILGGVLIPHDRGLIGHSDADVVLHAVADALLGATALGDIGEHYPDTDLQWRGLDSTKLLAEVVVMVDAEGWQPVNCDVTIHAQAPKLLGYKAAIKASVARLLGLEEGAVNIKAKTGEHVGPVGRTEAISCDAIILLQRKFS